MDEMLALLRDHPPCLLFEQLFLERLPDDFLAQVVNANIVDYRELARRADALWAARDMGATANAIRKLPPTRCNPKANPPKDEQGNLCSYHRRFGEAAKKCQDPCNWAENGQAGRP